MLADPKSWGKLCSASVYIHILPASVMCQWPFLLLVLMYVILFFWRNLPCIWFNWMEKIVEIVETIGNLLWFFTWLGGSALGGNGPWYLEDMRFWGVKEVGFGLPQRDLLRSMLKNRLGCFFAPRMNQIAFNGWWKNSCTSWDMCFTLCSPADIGIFTISTAAVSDSSRVMGASFLHYKLGMLPHCPSQEARGEHSSQNERVGVFQVTLQHGGSFLRGPKMS